MIVANHLESGFARRSFSQIMDDRRKVHAELQSENEISVSCATMEHSWSSRCMLCASHGHRSACVGSDGQPTSQFRDRLSIGQGERFEKNGEAVYTESCFNRQLRIDIDFTHSYHSAGDGDRYPFDRDTPQSWLIQSRPRGAGAGFTASDNVAQTN